MPKRIGHNILVIGDIHGNSDWEQITKDGLIHHYEILFLGDYIDSFFVKASDQLVNLNNLITFIKHNKTRVTALLGNHDFAAINSYSGISGYQYYYVHEYKKLFQDNIDLFQIAWGYTNPNTSKYTLATHAGLTKTFWNKYVKYMFNEGEYLNKLTGKLLENALEIPIHDTLNYLRDKGDILWKVGSMRGGIGTPGPLWADYAELIDDPYEGINQIFGHTPIVAPRIDHIGDDFIACIDTYGNKKCSSMLITL
jgi:Calcineurin-like phosphoesterase